MPDTLRSHAILSATASPWIWRAPFRSDCSSTSSCRTRASTPSRPAREARSGTPRCSGLLFRGVALAGHLPGQLRRRARESRDAAREVEQQPREQHDRGARSKRPHDPPSFPLFLSACETTPQELLPPGRVPPRSLNRLRGLDQLPHSIPPVVGRAGGMRACNPLTGYPGRRWSFAR
jgi:hypothetical protein